MENVKKFISDKFCKTRQAQPLIIEFSDFFQCENLFAKFNINFMKSNTNIGRYQEYRKIHFLTAKLATVLVIILSIANFIISLLPNGSVVLAIESSAAMGIFSLMLLKTYIVMIKYRGLISEIMEKLELHFPTDGWNQHVFKVREYLKTMKKFTQITAFIYTTIYFQLLLVPFCELIYGLMTSNPIEIELVIKFYIPFDYQNPFVYLIVYIFQSWIFLLNTVTLFLIESLYFGLTTTLSMEFDILGQVMSEIDPKEDQNASAKEMKDLVDVHQELIGLTEKLEEIFSSILFVNIFGMIYLICGTAFLSVSGISQYLLLKYFFGLITTMWNGFIQCYFGDRLMESSLSVAHGAYNSNWYDGSVQYKKLVYIVIFRSQKPQKLTALKYMNVCLETYKWIINKAYSFYSVLTAVYKA